MRIVQVQIAARAYPIFVGSGAREQIPGLLERAADADRIAIIADDAVANLHLDRILSLLVNPPEILRFPPGEESKTLEVAATLFDGLANARISRRDLILTLGGGVAGDLGGFVAATWLRGVRYIQIPTSLEAAIDASVGGKTAVNHRSAKNLIGAFHQPTAVIIDTDFLTTLPPRDYSAGLAESVKHAAARDPGFLAWQESRATDVLDRKPDALTELICRNCEIKAEIVAKDEREQSVRAVLNHGHTIGHAIEHLLGYGMRHGECVALGMLVENEIAVARGLLSRGVAERIRALIERFGLPTRLPRPLAAADVLAGCRLDKKNQRGAIHFVLLAAIGTPNIVANVSDAEIEAALAIIAPPTSA